MDDASDNSIPCDATATLNKKVLSYLYKKQVKKHLTEKPDSCYNKTETKRGLD
jgi:hypothetical protein